MNACQLSFGLYNKIKDIFLAFCAADDCLTYKIKDEPKTTDGT